MSEERAPAPIFWAVVLVMVATPHPTLNLSREVSGQVYNHYQNHDTVFSFQNMNAGAFSSVTRFLANAKLCAGIGSIGLQFQMDPHTARRTLASVALMQYRLSCVVLSKLTEQLVVQQPKILWAACLLDTGLCHFVISLRRLEQNASISSPSPCRRSQTIENKHWQIASMRSDRSTEAICHLKFRMSCICFFRIICFFLNCQIVRLASSARGGVRK